MQRVGEGACIGTEVQWDWCFHCKTLEGWGVTRPFKAIQNKSTKTLVAIQKMSMLGYGKDSVGKTTYCIKMSSNPKHPHKSWPLPCMPQASLPASLVEMVSFRLSVRPCLREIRWKTLENKTVNRLWVHEHRHTHLQTQVYTIKPPTSNLKSWK